MKHSRRNYLLAHALIAACVPLFFLYRAIVTLLPDGMTGCILHDYLFLYCPLCGGTRAVEALLAFDLVGAIEKNVFVVLLLLAFIVLDVIALCRMLRGEDPWCVYRHAWLWIALSAALVLFGVLRNYLMIAHGIDPTGDLGRLWQALLN